jgi:hypothetical protein
MGVVVVPQVTVARLGGGEADWRLVAEEDTRCWPSHQSREALGCLADVAAALAELVEVALEVQVAPGH